MIRFIIFQITPMEKFGEDGFDSLFLLTVMKGFFDFFLCKNHEKCDQKVV